MDNRLKYYNYHNRRYYFNLAEQQGESFYYYYYNSIVYCSNVQHLIKLSNNSLLFQIDRTPILLIYNKKKVSKAK